MRHFFQYGETKTAQAKITPLLTYANQAPQATIWKSASQHAERGQIEGQHAGERAQAAQSSECRRTRLDSDPRKAQTQSHGQLTMKLVTVFLALFFSLCCFASETEKIKSDLIGHTTGGREKTWKFQSVDQIKQITIDSHAGNVYFLTLVLHDSRVSGIYSARVKVTYSGGKVQSVGLLSIQKI